MIHIIIGIIFTFTGCLEYPIYKEKTGISEQNISCLKIITLEDSDQIIARKYLKASENCKYELVLTPHIIHDCQNPQVKSLGSDIDGYVSLKLYSGNRSIFRSQTDFKGEDHSSHLERLLEDFILLDEVKEIKR